MGFKTESMSANSFAAEFREKLSSGKAALLWLLHAYNWASDNWKEIAKYTPDFDRNALRREFRAVYNFDPVAFWATARKYGGGKTAARIDAGASHMFAVGAVEAIQAARDLSAESCAELAKRFPNLNGFDRAEYDAEVQKLQKVAEGTKPRLSWKERCIELERENAQLRTEVDILKELLTETRQAKKAAS